MVKGRQSFIILAKVQVSIAEADLQLWIIRRQGCGFLQFGGGFGILVPLGIHCAQVGMGEFVERIDLQLLVECGYRIVVLALLPVDAAQIVVGVLVVGIDFDLLVEGRNGFGVFAETEVGQPQVVPGKFVFRVDFGGALKKFNRKRKIAAGYGGTSALDQIVGLHVGGRGGRAGDGILQRKKLSEIGVDGVAKRLVVRSALLGQFIL